MENESLAVSYTHLEYTYYIKAIHQDGRESKLSKAVLIATN